MLERCGYRTALYLSALIAAVNWSFLIYLRWYLPHLGNGIEIYAVAAVVILIGLWLLSRIARYAGAAIYFLSAGVVAFTLWDFEVSPSRIHLRDRPCGGRRHTDRYRQFYPTSQWQVARIRTAICGIGDKAPDVATRQQRDIDAAKAYWRDYKPSRR